MQTPGMRSGGRDWRGLCRGTVWAKHTDSMDAGSGGAWGKRCHHRGQEHGSSGFGEVGENF